MAQQRLGRFQEIEQWLLRELQRDEGASAYSHRLALTLCILHRNAALFVQLGNFARHLVDSANKTNLSTSKAWGQFFLALACYERNELDAAIAHLESACERRHGVNTLVLRRIMSQLALTYQAHGRPDAAERMYASLVQLEQEMIGAVSHETHALQACLALRRGEPESGVMWAQSIQPTGPSSLDYFLIPDLVRAELLVADGAPDSLAQALCELDELRRAAEQEHIEMALINVLAIQSLALEAQGNSDKALELLERAVTLARPGDLVRTFVDRGSPMADLLARLAGQGAVTAYVARILAAFPRRDDAHTYAQRNGKVSPSAMEIADLLTQREVEVLHLLDQQLSNKQIAQQLVITPETVQRHAANIFTKLAVHNRRQAVAKARDLGVLSKGEHAITHVG
jgi:LuxR family maltose regulon positive regulatory protein